MERWKLTNHQLVEASPEQLNHKQVQKARKGRQLTLAMMMKVARTLNIAVWERLKKEEREVYFEYLHKHLRGYFLRYGLRCLRKDCDGWATSSELLGNRIRAARNRMGLTQAALAELLNVTKGTLLTWESNSRIPSRRASEQIREVLGWS